MREGGERVRGDKSILLGVRNQAGFFNPGCALRCVCKDHEALMSGVHEVHVPGVHGRGEARDRVRRCAPRHLAAHETLTDRRAASMARGLQHCRRTTKHDVLPPEVPVSVAVEGARRGLAAGQAAPLRGRWEGVGEDRHGVSERLTVMYRPVSGW